MYKFLLSSSVFALLCVSSFAQADTTSMIDQTFFNIGGPSKAPAVVAVATPAAAEVKQDDPMPDPALFTQVQNLSEQTNDNAVNIFGLGKRAAANEASTATVAQGTIAAATTPANPQGLPDPSLFTNTGSPKDQTRDHPFKLF